jgi:formylmethanofuran dehydrogenase subunit C
MKRIILRPRHAPALRVDVRGLTPSALGPLSADDIERVPLWHGTERIELGSLFNVRVSDAAHDTDVPTLVFAGDMRHFDRIGWEMAEGRVIVEGDAGDYAGARMAGGALVIDGNAGSHAACEMSGGRIEIGGNAGDFAAGALPGDLDGMRGGQLIVRGNAGARFGDRMRRGMALVFGDAGDFAASRMVAGTIGIGGSVGEHLAYGMRRGTVVLPTTGASSSFRFAENHGDVDVFSRLMVRSLSREGGCFSELSLGGMRRFVGDVSVDGKGEVMVGVRS